MLTAEKARELANDFEKRRQAKNYVGDHVLPQIEKQAVKGNTTLALEICKPELESFIVNELENLGYHVYVGNSVDLCTLYIISW